MSARAAIRIVTVPRPRSSAFLIRSGYLPVPMVERDVEIAVGGGEVQDQQTRHRLG